MTELLRKPRGDWKWWVEARFGMFIHWGLYALPARHEWVKNRERITDEEYQKYFDHFNPDLYDPRAWARTAKEAGMKYVVVTTKHHEGFCLWDSKYTDYKATNTPYGKDLLRPLVEAFREEGLRIGFYYSLIDWHHPEFPVDRLHPMRDNKEFREKNKDRDIRKYAEYLHAQVRELLTEFGRIDVLFLDFSYPGEDGKGREDWQSEKLVRMVRELQPHILINDRADLLDTDWGWDFRTPEQVMVREWPQVDGQRVLWETCQTFSGSWGYHRDEATWKSVDQLVRMLIDTVSKGGEPPAQRRADGAGRVRRAGHGEAAGDRQVDEAARPLHLRLHPGAGGVQGAPGLPADLQPRDEPAVRTCVRLALPSAAPGWPGGEGGVRPAAQRRLGDQVHRGPRGAGAVGGRGRGHGHPGAPRAEAQGDGAGDRAVPEVGVQRC